MTTAVQPSAHGDIGSPQRTKIMETSPAFSPMKGPLGSCAGPDAGFTLGFNHKAAMNNSEIMSTEMHAAANNADAKTIEDLLDKGEDLDARSIYGESALHRAVRTGSVDTVQVLLDGGAPVHGRDAFGKTPLMVVCGTKQGKYKPAHLATVVKLMENGADPLMTDHKGRTALSKAACNGHVSIVLLLLRIEGASVEVTDEFGRTPLMEAAKGKHVKVAELLLRLDRAAGYRKHTAAKVNLQDEDGKSALMLAAASGKVELVDMLLKNGADPELEDKEGKTALRYCKKSPECKAKIEGALAKASGGGKKKKAD